MNRAPAHSNSAVPSMLTVAPMGRTKLVTLFEAPTFSLTHFIVIGRVAADELVEKAMAMAEAIAR